MSELTALDHDNLSNTVYATLCDALMKGRFQPGDRLRIRDLAEQLGTSVTPVRDAILRLTQDEAVIFQSARNMRIPVLTKQRYLEIRAIRLRLESLAAETAAQLATKADMEILADILNRNEIALQEGDRLAGPGLNQAFHFELTRIAQLPLLQGILRRLWLQMGPIIADTYLDGGRSMIDFHYPVLEAIRNRDSSAAANAIMTDIERGGHAILQRVNEPGENRKSAL